MDTLTISVTEIDHPESRWLNIVGGIFEEDNLTVILEWESNSDCLDFTVSLTSSTDASDQNITTKIKRHIFSVLYNTNYTVTIISSIGSNSSEISKAFYFIKCEPPSHPENVVVNGYVSPALENAQISLSCPPDHGLSFPHSEVISTCTGEGVWSPDISLLDLECQQRDCGQLFSMKGVYRILNQTNENFSVGSIMEFQCVHTPYQIDPLFTTQCLAGGLWDPHPRDVCPRLHTSRGLIAMGYGEIVVAPLGAVIVLLCLALVGTLSALLIIISRYKKERINRTDYRIEDQITELVPGSSVLTPNVSYELTKISQKRVPHDNVQIGRNPAYAAHV